MIRVHTQNIDSIRSKTDLRLSPNYYHLNVWFDKVKSQGFDIYLLSDINQYIDSGSYIADYYESGIPFIRVGDIKKYVIDETELKYVSPKVKSKSKLKFGDIFFGRTQATFSKLGVFSFASPRLAGSAVSQHVAKVQINEEIIDPYYVVAYLNSKFGRSQMVLASYGDTRVEFTNNQIGQIRIVKLPKDDYEKIIELTKAIIDLNEKQINSFNLAQSVLDKAFNSLANPDSNPETVVVSMLRENDLWTPITYKKEYVEVRNLIKHHSYRRIEDVFSKVLKGIEVGSKNYRTEVETTAASIPFIRTSDIYNGEVDMYPDYFFDPSDDLKIKVPHFMKDDILFSKDGKIGQCSIINGDGNFIPGSGYFVLRAKNKNEVNYLFALFCNSKIIRYQALMKTVIATTIPHLKREKFDTILIPDFDDSVKQEVSSLIDDYRALLIEKNKKIKEVQNIFDRYYSLTTA